MGNGITQGESDTRSGNGHWYEMGWAVGNLALIPMEEFAKLAAKLRG